MSSYLLLFTLCMYVIERLETIHMHLKYCRCAEGGICSQAVGGQGVNPTNSLALYADCLYKSCHPPLHYQWSISYLNQYGFWKEIVSAQKYISGERNCWLNILND